MQGFIYNGLPSRVVFGRGTIRELGDQLRHLGCGRALLLATTQQREQVRAIEQSLPGLTVGLFAEAEMHTPVSVTERALEQVRSSRADCLIAIGGGSTIGLGKALALRTDLPQVVVPTTYAGSEMTPILGQTEEGRKTTLRSAKVLPEVVLYDVDLTFTLPAAMSAASGMNAIAHAVEGLYARDGNPIMSLMAEEGIRALAGALPTVMASPADVDARSDALYGAWLCGSVLGNVGMALHHKLCHTLGGSFGLPHAETHAVILPHATAYNSEAAPEAMLRVRRALGVSTNGAGALFDLNARMHLPLSLEALGFPRDALERAADVASENPYWNPRPVERGAILELLQSAWSGERPG